MKSLEVTQIQRNMALKLETQSSYTHGVAVGNVMCVTWEEAMNVTTILLTIITMVLALHMQEDIQAHNLDILIKVPDSIPPEVACMLPCSGLTTFSALQKTKPFIEEGVQTRGDGRLLIVGAGGLGNWCLQLGKAMFDGKKVFITVADISQEKLDQAEEDGADFIQLWKTKSPTNFAEYIKEMGVITQAGKHKFDAAIDFVGTKDTFNFSYRALRQKGTIVNVGLYGAIADVPLSELAIKQFVIQGNFVGTKSSLKELINFIQDRNVKYPHLEFIKLSDINETHERMKQGKVKGRALIKFEK